MHCYTQCPQPCSRPPLTHAFTGDSCTLTGESGSVSCGVNAPFSQVLVLTRFCDPQASVSPSCVSSGGSVVGLMVVSSKKDYGTLWSTTPRAFAPAAVYCWPIPPHTQTQFCLSLCGVSGFWCAQGLFEPSEPLWCVYSLTLNVISPLLPSYWGFSFALGRGVSPQSLSSTT